MTQELINVDIANFRSIRGHIHAPLDAKVVLIHGENGAGKTSLLSAIELALTGGVTSLRRADPEYESQLLHKRASVGHVEVVLSVDEHTEKFRCDLSSGGLARTNLLDLELSEFFEERAYLPQALLGQLLQIYQEAGSDASSPLSRFVSSLLGLDRFDALEGGLQPLVDVRNVRKVVDGWSAVENEVARMAPLIKDRQNLKDVAERALTDERDKLRASLRRLGLAVDADFPERTAVTSDDNEPESKALDGLTDMVRVVGSIRRDLASNADNAAKALERELSRAVREAAGLLETWNKANRQRVAEVRSRIVQVFPNFAVVDQKQFHTEALRVLGLEYTRLSDQVTRARNASTQLARKQDQLFVADKQLSAIDGELQPIASNSGALARALAELSPLILDDICPVCGRDYRDLSQGSLADHVHSRTR